MPWLPCVFQLSARLPPDLEVKLIHDRLDPLRRAWMFLSMVKYNRQHKGALMLIDRHPFIREQYAGAAVYLDHMMIVIHQLLCLLTRADRRGVIEMDLVERGHEAMLPPTTCSWAFRSRIT